MRSYLIIGLGGSGITIAKSVKERIKILKEYNRIINNQFQLGFTSLYLDTDSFLINDEDFYCLGGQVESDPNFSYFKILSGGLASLRDSVTAGAGGLTPSISRAALINRFRTRYKEFISKIEKKIGEALKTLSWDNQDELNLIYISSLFGSTGIGLIIDISYLIENFVIDALRSQNRRITFKKIGLFIIPSKNALDHNNNNNDSIEKAGRTLIGLEQIISKAMHPSYIYNSYIDPRGFIGTSPFDMVYVIDHRTDPQYENIWWDKKNNSLNPLDKSSSTFIAASNFLYYTITDNKNGTTAFAGKAFQDGLDWRINGIKKPLEQFPYLTSFGLSINTFDIPISVVLYNLKVKEKIIENLTESPNNAVIRDISEQLIKLIRKNIKANNKNFGINRTVEMVVDEIKVFLINKFSNNSKIGLDGINKIFSELIDLKPGIFDNSFIKQSINLLKQKIINILGTLNSGLISNIKDDLKKSKNEISEEISSIEELQHQSTKYIKINYFITPPNNTDVKKGLNDLIYYFLNNLNNPSILKLSIYDKIKELSFLMNFQNQNTYQVNNNYPKIHLTLKDNFLTSNKDSRRDEENGVELNIFTNICFTDLDLSSDRTVFNDQVLRMAIYDLNTNNVKSEWVEKFMILNDFSEIKPENIVEIYEQIKLINSGGTKYLMLAGIRSRLNPTFIDYLYTDSYIDSIEFNNEFLRDYNNVRSLLKSLIGLDGLSNITLDSIKNNFPNVNNITDILRELLEKDIYYHLWFNPLQDIFKTSISLDGIDSLDLVDNTICVQLMCVGCKYWKYHNLFARNWCQSGTNPPAWINRENLKTNSLKYACYQE